MRGSKVRKLRNRLKQKYPEVPEVYKDMMTYKEFITSMFRKLKKTYNLHVRNGTLNTYKSREM